MYDRAYQWPNQQCQWQHQHQQPQQQQHQQQNTQPATLTVVMQSETAGYPSNYHPQQTDQHDGQLGQRNRSLQPAQNSYRTYQRYYPRGYNSSNFPSFRFRSDCRYASAKALQGLLTKGKCITPVFPLPPSLAAADSWPREGRSIARNVVSVGTSRIGN